MSKINLVVEREKLSLTMSRVFNAPREKIWQAFADPELIPKWWGQKTSQTVVDKMDFKVGGDWRYVEKTSDGEEYAFRGIYKEIQAPEKLTYTFEFEPLAGHVCTDHVTLKELPDGKTKVTTFTTFDNVEDLDGMIKSGMEKGANQSWDQLEELVTKL